jgi:hypothetical protein
MKEFLIYTTFAICAIIFHYFVPVPIRLCVGAVCIGLCLGALANYIEERL